MKKAVKNVTAAAIPNAKITANIMAIYTKTGDTGITSLFNGKRLPKSSKVFEAYGSVDELSSFIGLVIFKLKEREKKELLTEIQKDLYLIMVALSGKKIPLIKLDQRVNKFEQIIDDVNTKLPKLNRFILPQGSELTCWFHILRTVCRRVERRVVQFSVDNKIVKYLNRLSDLFFVLARYFNQDKELTI